MGRKLPGFDVRLCEGSREPKGLPGQYVNLWLDRMHLLDRVVRPFCVASTYEYCECARIALELMIVLAIDTW